MQKVIALFVASLLLFPAGTVAQDFKAADGRATGQASVATAPIGSLRESAIRQAKLAAANDALAQATKSPSYASRHPIWFGTLMGILGGTVTGFVMCGNSSYGGDIPCEWYALTYGPLFGAGIGAITGAIVGAVRRD